MSKNIYEIQLRDSLRGEIKSHFIRDLGVSTPFFTQLMRAFPISGSRIDWSRVPSSVTRVEEDETLQSVQFAAFFDEVIRKFHLSGEVVYVGDSATDFALAGPLERMIGILDELLIVPQHHYFIGNSSAWCACLTMEGDMGFGFRPSPNSSTNH